MGLVKNVEEHQMGQLKEELENIRKGLKNHREHPGGTG
jgi:hypothetical protein